MATAEHEFAEIFERPTSPEPVGYVMLPIDKAGKKRCLTIQGEDTVTEFLIGYMDFKARTARVWLDEDTRVTFALTEIRFS